MSRIIFAFFCSFFALLSYCPVHLEGAINWQTNYQSALSEAKSSSKPIVLFFTGSDWCTWCIKLEEEALSTQEFSDAVGDKFIFVKLDFPLSGSQDPQIRSQNKQLQQKYNIHGYPTILLVDPQQEQQIGSTGYRQGGGRAYAEYLQQLLRGHSAYRQQVNILNETELSGEGLKSLYQQAKKLQLEGDSNRIAKRGIHSNESLFFLTERYQALADAGQIHCKEAISLRQQLLSADIDNEKQIPYQVALIEFEAYAGEEGSDQYSPEIAIAPLNAYIEKFGSKDKENLWRLQMMILQVYLDHCELHDALGYAQDCYESAPYAVQPELARAIYNIRSQIRATMNVSSNASHRIEMD